MKVQVEISEVYGVAKVYPICETAKIFAKIAGTKTLTTETLKNMEKLGYELEVITSKGHLDLIKAVRGGHGQESNNVTEVRGHG